MIPQAKLAESFRRERASRGLTLQAVRDLTGVSASTLCRFERDVGRLDMVQLIAVANWLNIDLMAKPVVVYPKNTLDAILDVIRADDSVRDKDSLCTLFSVCYRGMAKV